MSEPHESLDAYRSPDAVTAEPSGARPRSRSLTVIAVIAIVLGGFGLVNALAGAIGLALGSQIQSAFGGGGPQGQLPEELEQAQREMERDMLALQREFRVPSAVAVFALLAVAGGLLAGGIQTLRRVPAGPRILTLACCLAIPFELLARGVLQTMIQFRTATMLKEHTQRVLEGMARPDLPPAAERLFGLPYLIFLGSIIVMLGLLLLKVVYYAVAIWYLRKPAVRAEFEAVSSRDASHV